MTAQPTSVEALQARCRELEEEIERMAVINEALMNRVERDVDRQGSAFSLFQAATALEQQVNERTAALSRAMKQLEVTNRELQVSNEAAQDANRAKSAFLATMSHELRTPMNGVVGMTELLLRTPLDEKQRRSVETIRRSALSLLHILNDILDFSKIEAGRMELESTPFDLRDATENALQILRMQIERKGLKFVMDWPRELPRHVVGDSMRFAQILTNLVGNATKFTRRGEIRLRARVVEDRAERVLYRFEIEDTGIGIREELIPTLFESFTQSDRSVTRQFGGTGLGLAIVRRLSALMGGSCGATSQIGRGSCFWFTLAFERATAEAVTLAMMPRTGPGARPTGRTQILPALKMPERDTAPAETSPAPARRPRAAPRAHPKGADPALPKLRILLVEDNLVNQEVARGMLEALGYESKVAENGRRAYEILTAAHPYDLVLMDCQMPEMDGLEATRRIRAHETEHGMPRVPIVALTANAMIGDRDNCLAAGMDDFLSKPFRMADLGEKLRGWAAACLASRPQPG